MAPRKPKASELTYKGTEGPGERKIVALHEDRIVGYLASEMQEGAVGKGSSQRKLSMAWTHPDFRRRGVGATMLNLEHERTGYTPVGDTALSTRGAAFQRGLGVPTNPKGQVINDSIGRAMEGVSHESITRVQPSLVANATQFPPGLVRGLSPVKPSVSRRPKPEQGQLFDTAKYTVPPKRRDQVLGRTEPLSPKGTIQRKAGGKFASRKRSDS